MAKFSVIKTGGKQYLVRENDEITVDRVDVEQKKNIELETLATFEDNGEKMEIGSPSLKTKTKAVVLDNIKGDKIRVARFKSKVRYRKVKGFRPALTKIKITSI